jgi:hypothetical protein
VVKYDDRCYLDDKKDLLDIFENQRLYKKLVDEASGIILEDLGRTLNELRPYMEGKNAELLTDDMRKMLDKIDKKM